jgi:hypothetical protein
LASEDQTAHFRCLLPGEPEPRLKLVQAQRVPRRESRPQCRRSHWSTIAMKSASSPTTMNVSTWSGNAAAQNPDSPWCSAQTQPPVGLGERRAVGCGDDDGDRRQRRAAEHAAHSLVRPSQALGAARCAASAGSASADASRHSTLRKASRRPSSGVGCPHE